MKHKLQYRTTRRGTRFGPRLQEHATIYDVAAASAQAGIDAFKKGVTECPYPTGSINEKAWWEAWEAAQEFAERYGTVHV
jgi:hypothetical protein